MLRNVLTVGRGCLLACVLVAASCSHDPRKNVQQGDQYFAAGKFSDAIIEYRTALEREPRSGETISKLAEAYLHAGDTRDALTQYLRAADVSQGDATTQIKTAGLLVLADRFDEAAARAQKALELDPKNIPARIMLGNAYAGLKNFDAAVEDLDDAIRDTPGDSLPYAALGYVESAHGDTGKAETAFKQALEIAPNSVDALLSLGDLYWASHRIKDAEPLFTRAHAIDPKNARANHRLVLLYLLTGRAPAAEPLAKAIADNSIGLDQFALADYYTVTGRTPEAVATLQALTKAPAVADEAQLRLAMLDARAGRAADAQKRVDGILAHDSGNARALVLRAKVLFIQGQLSQALASATAAVTADPTSDDALSTQGLIYSQSGKLEDAIGAYEKAFKLNPRSPALMVQLTRLHLRAGGTTGAAQFAEQAVELDPSNPTARLLLVRALKADGSLAEAGQVLDKLERDYPDAAVVQVERGGLLLAAKNSAGAAHAFARALSIDPSSIDALAGLVAIDIASNHPNDARARIAARLAKAPNDAALLLLAAGVYHQTQDDASSETVLRKAIALDPNNLDAYRMLGQTLVHARKLDEARTEFEQIVAENPTSVGASTAIGVVLELQNKADEARQQYEKTLQLDSTAAVAANNLAWLLMSQGGDLDRALRLAQTAMAQLPDRPEISDTLGWIYYKQKNWQLAVSHLQESVARDPRNPILHYHLGLALVGDNNAAAARNELRQALKLRSDFDGAADAKSVLASLD